MWEVGYQQQREYLDDKNLPSRFEDWMYKECRKTNNL